MEERRLENTTIVISILASQSQKGKALSIRNVLQSNLGFRTSRSSNNSVFERKIQDGNHSVLEQKFGSQTTQEKDLPESSAAAESILCGPRTLLKL